MFTMKEVIVAIKRPFIWKKLTNISDKITLVKAHVKIWYLFSLKRPLELMIDNSGRYNI